MMLLAIETATDACSVALQTDEAVIQRASSEPRVHAASVLGMVQACLEEASVRLDWLDGLVFGRGPGSFTGVRIAAGVIQGLALGSGLPVVPVSTLAAHAVAAARVFGRRRVAVAVDARMGECYWGLYRVDAGLAEPVGDELIVAPEAIDAPPGKWAAVGSGWAVFPGLAEAMPGVEVVDTGLLPLAGDLLENGAAVLAAGRGLKAEEALPVYLREEVAWRGGK
jgi:tRNA threonylcarbamoyladenosine biosynthesis protein TsaB